MAFWIIRIQNDEILKSISCQGLKVGFCGPAIVFYDQDKIEVKKRYKAGRFKYYPKFQILRDIDYEYLLYHV